MSGLNQSIEKRMAEFEEKTYEEKKEKAFDLLTKLSEKGNKQAGVILNKIGAMVKVPDAVLNAIRKDFCTSLDKQQKEELEKKQKETAEGIDKYRKGQDKIIKIQTEEQKAKEKDYQDCENLLAQIEDLPTNEIIIG